MTFSKILNSYRDKIPKNFIFRSTAENLILLCIVFLCSHCTNGCRTLFKKSLSTAGNSVRDRVYRQGDTRLGLFVTEKANNYELLLLSLLLLTEEENIVNNANFTAHF